MKEQIDNEIQSMNKIPRHDNNDDSEYARMIEMSENLGRGM